MDRGLVRVLKEIDMPTQKISTTLGSKSVAIDHVGALNQIQRWFAAPLEKGERWIRSPLLRIRPRMSLFSGSVLVLLTLFLPIAWESNKGYEFVRVGEGSWLGLLGVVDHEIGRGFYILSLASAAVTILVVLALDYPDFLRKQRLMVGLFVIAGSIFLLAVLDLFLLGMGFFVVDWFGHVNPAWDGLLIIFILLSCFSPALAWGRKGLIVWIALTSDIPLSLTLRSPPDLLAVLPWLIFALLPMPLWYRFRFSRHHQIRARWPRIRRGPIALYVPAVLVDCWFFVVAVSAGVWGLLPYWHQSDLSRLHATCAQGRLGYGSSKPRVRYRRQCTGTPCGFNYLAGDQD